MKKIVIPIIAVILLLAGYKLFFPWTTARNPKPAGPNIICFGDSLTSGTGAVENMVSNILVSR
jgi:hypothetical protein